MNLKNKLVAQKIYEAWSPKIRKHLEAKGKKVSEQKLRSICEASQIRKIYESVTSTTANTNGRGAFSFGNNPTNASDTAQGSGENFDSMFGVFIDTYADCVGFDLISTTQMTKSNLLVTIVEPIYADGKIDATTKEDMPEIFQVKTTKTSSPVALVVGTEYTVTDGTPTDQLKMVYVGKDRIKGLDIFRVTSVETAGLGKTIATILSTGAGGKITVSGGTYTFVNGSVSYVNAYANFVHGFAGSGSTNASPFTSGRSTGSAIAEPMNRETGETATIKNMGLRKYSNNFSAETYNVKISYTLEFLQDMAMEEGLDVHSLAYDTIANELEQNINDEIISKHYGLGWGAHADINNVSGINLNLHLADTAGSAQTHVDYSGVSRTIGAANGALIATANGDNLPNLQRRIVSRLTFASSAIGQRSRKGKGNIAMSNARLSGALQDCRGFALAPFENDLHENDGLYQVGTLRKIQLFEDPMAELNDDRISVGNKGTSAESGLHLMTYILAEKIEVVTEQMLTPVTVLKSRLNISAVGNNPDLKYLTFSVTEGAGQSII
jgi:hypothetical protein